jgi:hypothetical protein
MEPTSKSGNLSYKSRLIKRRKQNYLLTSYPTNFISNIRKKSKTNGKNGYDLFCNFDPIGRNPLINLMPRAFFVIRNGIKKIVNDDNVDSPLIEMYEPILQILSNLHYGIKHGKHNTKKFMDMFKMYFILLSWYVEDNVDFCPQSNIFTCSSNGCFIKNGIQITYILKNLLSNPEQFIPGPIKFGELSWLRHPEELGLSNKLDSYNTIFEVSNSVLFPND